MSARILSGWAWAAGVAVVLAGACGGEEGGGGAACGAGDTRACLGPGQCAGAQVCLADGSGYGACDCGGGADAGADASGGGAGVSGAGGASGSGGSGGGGTSGSGGGGGTSGSSGSSGSGGSGSGGSGTSGGGGASGSGGTGGAGAGGSGGTSGGGGTSGSGGSGGGAPCPSGRGPAMARIGAFCIDTTEVTQEQYTAFVTDKAGDTSGQRAECAGVNVSYAPIDAGTPACDGQYDWESKKPANCIDWCDAAAFCAWAGKRLCGAVGGGPASADNADPTGNEWHATCTQGGTSTYAYGSALDQGQCVWPSFGLASVQSMENCRGTVPPYDQVYDLTGNAWEFVDLVLELPAPGGGTKQWNPIYGGSGTLGDLWKCTDWTSVPGLTGSGSLVGFRCCAD